LPGDPVFLNYFWIKNTDMFSLMTTAKAKKIKLIFPDGQNLWAFFSMAEVSDFRIESSRHVFIGKLRQDDIEFAKQRLGAVEVKKDKAISTRQIMAPLLHFHSLKYALRFMI
jgi:hypothetical protein